MESHPEWFTEEVIPARFSGERFYDPDRRWIGTCLSTFGIAYNLDSLERLGVTEPPERWSDLGKAVYFDEIAMADPTKSGSATKAFEMLIQEQIRATFKPLRKNKPWLTEEEIQARALQRGWTTGLNLIQRICANARYFSDSSGKIPFDVMQGSAAAGMCIDFYGRTTSEFVKQPDGTSRVGFVMPENGTSVSVDPIGMLRGAPHPELAREFISFVLSPSGQQLWNYRVGEKDGPRHVSLRRLPVRRDLYTAAHLQFFSDPEVMPYEAGSGFEYVAEWTAPTFSALQFIIRCMCLDPHDELKEAWLALVENNFPPQASAAFFEVGFVDYNKASNHIAETLRSGHRVYQVSLARQLTAQFRNHYWRAAELARKGL